MRPATVTDVVADDEGVWATSPVPGTASQRRPVPTAAGMSSATVWPLAIDADLPTTLAALLTGGRTTPRLAALAELTAVLRELTAEQLVPRPVGDGWAWGCAPEAATAVAIAEVVSRGHLAGLTFQAADPIARATELVESITAALHGAATGPWPVPHSARGRGEWGRWADRVRDRRAANARLVLRLDAPQDDADWRVTPLALQLDAPTTRYPFGEVRQQHLGTTHALLSRWHRTERDVLAAAWPRGPLRLTPRSFTVEEVLELLDKRADALERRGVELLAPAGLLRRSSVRRRVRATPAPTGELGLAALAIDVGVEVDGQALSDDELHRLAAAKAELVSVRGRWVRVEASERDRLARLLARLEDPVSPADLLADEAFDGADLEGELPLAHGLAPARRVAAPRALRAQLRPYQRAGLDWLTWLEANDVGGVLADDMGLGKTVQVLARIVADHAGPTLVVCPVTLVDTWLREAGKFAPRLKVHAYHGADREDLDRLVTRSDVVVTTYGLLARDEQLRQPAWHRVVLDEAQAVKNPDTHAARAARSLTATHRLAVTGTPVENHVGDLWSLFAFALPGLLPRRRDFEKRFVRAAPDEGDLRRLRAVVGPFVLRRAKTDPDVLPDLPDRVVVRDDCGLTREQVGAYEAAVRALLDDSGQEGIARRGAVLAGLSRLKQICVHPALLTERRSGLGGRSGKVDRLVSLLGEILDEGQAVVVFTQFASFVPDLAAHLSEQLGVPVATLTGADDRKRRAATVADFSAAEGPPVLVASLKAGGTGLTLVRANHVIHLDRWWNPAVEDQASDRVWRIGQDKKVMVHTLVCPGTLEERIDTMLSGKRAVAASVVRSTEAAITELTTAELADLVTLVRERVAS